MYDYIDTENQGPWSKAGRAMAVLSLSISAAVKSIVKFVITITVSKMTSHCTDTVQMREESESGIRK